MAIAVLVVNYFSSRMTLDLLRDLAQQSMSDNLIVSIADNSNEDSEYLTLSAGVEERRAEFLGVSITRSESNKGFASGNHIAYQAISEMQDIEYVVIVNPDVSIVEGSLENLTRELSDCDTEPMVAVAKTTSSFGTSCGAAAISKLTGRSRSLGLNDSPSASWIIYPSGHFMAMRRETWDQIGGFDRRYFLYGEELDFTLRSGLRRDQIRMIQGFSISHVGGGTTKSDSIKSKVTLYHSARSRAIAYRKHSALRPYFTTMVLFRTLYGMRLIIRGRPGGEILRGLVSGCRYSLRVADKDV